MFLGVATGDVNKGKEVGLKLIGLPFAYERIIEELTGGAGDVGLDDGWLLVGGAGLLTALVVVA